MSSLEDQCMSSYVTIIVLVEGPTEQKFVSEIMYPYLFAKGIMIFPIVVGKKGHQGGDIRYSRVQRDIELHLKQRSDTYLTLFIDYYGIDSNWPGYQDSLQLPTAETKADCVNTATKALVVDAYAENSADSRFIPFVTMHEFEALLFSDTEKLANGISKSESKIEAIISQFSSPEEINNSPTTAPSKRLNTLVDGKFMKTTAGIAIARDIGIDKMREKCPVFNEWVDTLEGLHSINNGAPQCLK